jgi:glutamate transport system permease protein
MSASVLFDAPGPKTVARHRIYSVISIAALVAMVAFAIWTLYDAGQLEYALWEPFVTPEYVEYILVDGLLETLKMAFFSIIFAVVFGLVFGVAKLSDHGWVRWPAWLVVEFFRAVPVLLLMVFAFFLLAIGNGPLSSFWCVVIALTLYNGSVLAEVFRAGINAVPRGQAEAAYAIGMRKSQVMTTVLLPQAVKIMLPAIISQMVVALKDTSLGYYILAPGLTAVGKPIYLEFSNQVPTAIVITGIYVAVNLVLTWVATLVQKRLVGEKKVLDVPMVGPGARQRQRDRALALLGHPEPDLALDDHGAVGAHAPHAHRQVVPLPHLRRPLPGVGLGDARDVGRGLGGVGHLHALRDPASVARDRRLGQRSHGGLEPVAQGDGVHRPDVVVHPATLGDDELDVVRLDHGEPAAGWRRSRAPSG